MHTVSLLAILLWTGSDGSAARWVDELGETDPRRFVTFEAAGIVRPSVTLGDRAAARSQLEEVVARAPALLQGLHHDELVRSLERAIAGLSPVAADPSDAEQIFVALTLMGRALEELGQHGQAVDVLARAASMRPDTELDPARFSPPVLTAWTEARARVRGARASRVSLEWLPRSAEAFVDGRAVTPASPGRAQIEILGPGEHVVLLRANGFRTGVVRLRAGEAAPRLIALIADDSAAERSLAIEAARVVGQERVAVVEPSGGRARVGLAGPTGGWAWRTSAASVPEIARAIDAMLAPASRAPATAVRRDDGGEPTPWYGQWWAIAIGAAVIAGGVTLGIVLATQGGDDSGCPDDACIPL